MKLPEWSLKQSVNSLEDGIITLSGPALAVSGIIAGLDLLTGGNMLKQIWWLSLAWAICLLLTLDFQVLSLGARAHKVYLSSDKSGWQKFAEIAIAFVIAGAISYVSIQMQSIIARSNSAGLDIATATAQLGINPLWLIWERSALVLVLIFMSGWFREEQTVPGGTNTALTDEALQLILSKLAKLDALEQALAQPVIVSEQEASTLQLQAPASEAQNVLANGEESTDKQAEPLQQPLAIERFQSKEQAIADVLQRLPGATPEQVAQEAGCSVRTAAKWIQRLQQEPGA